MVWNNEQWLRRRSECRLANFMKSCTLLNWPSAFGGRWQGVG